MKMTVKKQISIVISMILTVMLGINVFVSASEHPASMNWKVSVLGSRSNYPWAKYQEVKPEQARELMKYLTDSEELSSDQEYYFDQDNNETLNLVDLIILKNRICEDNQENLVQCVAEKDINIVESKLRDGFEFTNYEVLMYDFDATGSLTERDLDMMKDCYKNQISENEFYFEGGNDALLDALDLAYKFEPECGEIEFKTGDLRQTKQRGAFCVFDNDVKYVSDENDGSYSVCNVTGYHYTEYVGPLNHGTSWYVKIS